MRVGIGGKVIHSQISSALDGIINDELMIKEELKHMLEIYIEEKAKLGFPFGTLCIIHYKEFATLFTEDIYKIAAAIELIILSFDIIDDLQDQDTNYIWMEKPELSLNAVLAMLTLANKSISNSTFQYREIALRMIEKYTLISISGQQQDLLNVCQDEVSYLTMIEQKSGSLTAMSCLVGYALACGRESIEVEEYARAIGVIQQIKNDIQGLKEWDNKNDLLNRKYSLPIIYLFAQKNNISGVVKKYYNEDVGECSLNKGLIKDFLFNKALIYALAVKNNYRNKGWEIIDRTLIGQHSKEYLQNLMR